MALFMFEGICSLFISYKSMLMILFCDILLLHKIKYMRMFKLNYLRIVCACELFRYHNLRSETAGTPFI